MVIYYENTFNIPYIIQRGLFTGLYLRSRNRIPQTGKHAVLFENKNNFNMQEFHEFIVSLGNFTVYDEERFNVLEELIS